jgi:hypothetical protein
MPGRSRSRRRPPSRRRRITPTIRITLTGIDPVAADAPVASGTTLLVGGFTIKTRAFKSGTTDSRVPAATYTLSEPLSGGAVASGANHTLLSTPESMRWARSFIVT